MHLVDHRGEIVPVGGLLEEIWHGRIAEPAYVRKAIHEIRSALDDDEGRIIRTVPKVGYVIEANAIEDGDPTSSDSSDPSSGQPLIYGRLSSDAYSNISRRLRKKRKSHQS